MKLSLFDTAGKKLTPLELQPADFGTKPSPILLAQALRVYEYNSHSRTSKVKTRGEVSGSTKKIWRQKGTGRARHGDRYAPIFVGGGVAHGPKGVPGANLTLPKKMRRKALSSALLVKLEEDSAAALKGVEKLSPKTTNAATLLSKIASHPKNKVLVISDSHRNNLYQATKNMQRVTVKRAELVSAYDVVSHDYIILTQESLDILKLRMRSGKLTRPSSTALPKKSASLPDNKQKTASKE